MTNARAWSKRLFLQCTLASTGAFVTSACSKRPGGQSTLVHPLLRIDPISGVTFIAPNNEMGQGVYTAQAMIMADALDADWPRLRIEFAPPGEAFFLPGTGSQETGGSRSISAWFATLERVGAAVREMLISAAAESWGVVPESCGTKSGRVAHAATGRSLSYEELAAREGALPVPSAPKVKPRSIVGKPVLRRDATDKAYARTQYTIDVERPSMLYAAIRQCPTFGGRVRELDDRGARAMVGVRSVLNVDPGAAVAVVADSYWQALRAVEAVKIKYDLPPVRPDSEMIHRELIAALDQPGAIAAARGDTNRAFRAAARIVSSTYEAPYLAHMPMEPPACVAEVSSRRCELWVGNQEPSLVRAAAARVASLPADAVTVHSLFMGGSFGRRLETDYIERTVAIAKAVGRPVKLIWTRREDIQHDFYRPAAVGRFKAGLDAKGRMAALEARLASPSILSRVDPNSVRSGLDEWAIKGVSDLVYDVDHLRVDYMMRNFAPPVGWWRSVEVSQNSFMTESFIDEVAHAAGVDPYRFRRAMVGHDLRLQAVLDRAVSKSGWGQALPVGRARGLSLVHCFGSRVAQVAEVSRDTSGVRVQHVTCSVDCGLAVHPSGVTAQIESGIAYGLSAALAGEITIRDGAVVQSNFDDCPALLMEQMPDVTVDIVESAAPPGGVGEVSVPGVAPAVVNALFALTGRRVRRLPIGEQLREGVGR